MGCSNPLDVLRTTKCRKAQGACTLWFPPPPAAWWGRAGGNRGKENGITKWMNRMERGGDQVGKVGKQLREKSKSTGEVLSREE